MPEYVPNSAGQNSLHFGIRLDLKLPPLCFLGIPSVVLVAVLFSMCTLFLPEQAFELRSVKLDLFFPSLQGRTKYKFD